MLSLGFCQLEQQVCLVSPHSKHAVEDQEPVSNYNFLFRKPGPSLHSGQLVGGVPDYSLLLQVQVLVIVALWQAQEQSFCGWFLRS